MGLCCGSFTLEIKETHSWSVSNKRSSAGRRKCSVALSCAPRVRRLDWRLPLAGAGALIIDRFEVKAGIEFVQLNLDSFEFLRLLVELKETTHAF